jgi:hypothetical protein
LLLKRTHNEYALTQGQLLVSYSHDFLLPGDPMTRYDNHIIICSTEPEFVAYDGAEPVASLPVLSNRMWGAAPFPLLGTLQDPLSK